MLDSGEWQAEDVDGRVLERAADRVVEAIRASAVIDAGRRPELRPGPYCTRAPSRDDVRLGSSTALRPSVRTHASC